MGLLLAKSGWWGSSHKHWFSFWGQRQESLAHDDLRQQIVQKGILLKGSCAAQSSS
jgi:hypothetical protein